MGIERQPPLQPEQNGYYDRVHRGAWVRRLAGVMTGATIGGAFGSVIGAVASFLPYALGAIGIAGASAVALPSLLTIASTAALFTGVAAFVGIAIASDVGVSAGAVAAGFEEQERREKERGITPTLGIGQEATKDMSAQTKKPKLFSWKVASITAPLFGTFGALTAASPHPAISSTVAMMTGTVGGLSGTAAMVASGVVFGMFGIAVAVKNAMISNKLSNFYTDLLTDKLFTDSPDKSPSKQPALSLEPNLHAAVSQASQSLQYEPIPVIERSTGKKYTDLVKRVTLEDIIKEQKTKLKSDDMVWKR